jgi:antitoxin component YwqK of YwqJK toxin-antitoxin module
MRPRVILSGKIALFIGLFFVSCIYATACGLSWEAPHTYFDGVDEQGHVMFVDKFESLDLGDGLTLPIYAMFKSNWQNSSPYLGQGWILPILESHIVQINDNTFQMWQPDGWYQYMGRSSSSDTILDGQSGWKALINGDTITAWAPCGWKLVYNQGKLVSMTTSKGRELDLIYQSNRVLKMQENGVTVLQVETDPQNGEVSGLTFNGKTIGLEQANKPIIQVIGNKNVVGLMERSLSTVKFPDGTTKNYSFGVDDRLNPTMKIQNRTISWDPESMEVLKDGVWTYKITPNGTDDTAISRVNSHGVTEFRSIDTTRGQEITKKADDSFQTVTNWFVTGPLSGKIRSIAIEANGTTKIVKRYSYDEQGRTIRVYDGTLDATIVTTYGENGTFSEEYSLNKGEKTTKLVDNKSIVQIAGPLNNLITIQP